MSEGSKWTVVPRAKTSASTVGIHWLMFKSEKSRQSRISLLFRNMEKSKVPAGKVRGWEDSHPGVRGSWVGHKEAICWFQVLKL